jgi:hypothetical protein
MRRANTKDVAALRGILEANTPDRSWRRSGTIAEGRRLQRRPFAAQQEPCDDDHRQH